MRWGKGDLTRTPVFSAHHTHSRPSVLYMDCEGKGVPVSHLHSLRIQLQQQVPGSRMRKLTNISQKETLPLGVVGRGSSVFFAAVVLSRLYFTERGRRERYCFKYQTHLSYQLFIDVLEQMFLFCFSSLVSFLSPLIAFISLSGEIR